MSGAAGPPDARRRALWSLVAQGLASANGLVTSIVAARALSTVEFGYFSAVITVALVFVGLFAALLAQPLLLTRGDPARLAAQARSTLFVAMIFGAIAGVLLIGGSFFFGHVRVALWVLAASFPFVAVSDAFRYFGSVLGRAYLAALLDALRLVLFLGLFAVFYVDAEQDARSLVVLWSVCAVVVGLAGLVIGERMTRPAKAHLRQFADPKFLGYQFSIEFLMGVVGSTVPMLSLGWFVSVEAIGYIRGVSTLFGPILVLGKSVVIVASPLLVARSVAGRTRLLVGMATLFSSATLLLMTFLLLLPDRYGQEILGDAWSGSRGLILPGGLQMVAIGILTTAQTGIRVARPRFSLVMNISAITWSFVCFLIGVTVGGLEGAAWGFATGAAGAALIAVAIYFWVRGAVDPDGRTGDVADARQPLLGEA